MMSLRPQQPVALTGFENINRYWDAKHGIWAAKLLPGQLYVTKDPDEVVVTVLGSCVSACIRDKISGIGGMNHFMLPTTEDPSDGVWNDQATRYGSYAMERLINEIMKAGGRRENLEMKLTGGGHVIQNMANRVGQRNIDFILEYSELEGIAVLSQDLGDIYPRKVMYYPSSGRLRVKRLKSLHNDTLLQREEHYENELEVQPAAGDVELF
ncbi:chemoreceptor glutamine deamidase CheD [Methylophaga sp.]|uniref:chemoreceptor glutamine deamidase CheD n=1 Tax=Methylophaga sp. TaxID=2024840 RepID=UPI003F6A514F